MRKRTAVKLGIILAILVPVLGWFQRDVVLDMVADMLRFAGRDHEAEALSHKAFLIGMQIGAEEAFGEDCVWISVPGVNDAEVVEVLLEELGGEEFLHFGISSSSPGGLPIIFVPERRRDEIVRRLEEVAGAP